MTHRHLVAIAAALGLAAASPSAQAATFFGVLHALYGDVAPGLPSDHPTEPVYLLGTDTGENLLLELDHMLFDPLGGAHRAIGRRVIVEGDLDPNTGRLVVVRIALEPVVGVANSHLLGGHAVGAQPWVTILCRFGDSPGVTPETPSFFDDLMAFMDVYWQQLSYGVMNLAGSTVVGWYDLPADRSEYLDEPGSFPGQTLDFDQLAEDCTAAADADIDFNDYGGINLMLNEDLDCCSWGGGLNLDLDGGVKSFDMTWMATWGWGNQDVVGQEMGHGFGLPHSSGPYSSTYDSQWDVMSGGGTCSPADPDFGCRGVHTVAFHKDALGWIPDPQRYEANGDPDQFVTLERLAEPTGNGFLTAQVPIGGSNTHFYSVEVRKPAGFDDQIPGVGVVIHEVDTTLEDRNAQVVDGDGDGDPNDDGAVWTPGEYFDDDANSIRIAVLADGGDTCDIVINPSNLPPVADAGPNRFRECTSPDGASATLDGSGSSDPDDDVLTFSWSAPGIVFDDPTSVMPTATFPLGSTVATLTVSDGMEEDSDEATVSVQDTSDPLVICPSDIVVECNQLGGVAATDPAIQAFLAGASASDVCDPSVPVVDDAPAFFGLGATPVTFSGSDDSGNQDDCVATVTVSDTTPPEIEVSLDPTSLWPPTHKLHTVTASVEVSDVCDPAPTFVLTAVTSNEPNDGLGDGATSDDVQGAAYGTADVSVELRAERLGNGGGRVYTLLYTAEDGAGNQAEAEATVDVSHDRR